MGKIRVAALGDEKSEKEAKRKADARREGKKAKKQKVEGLGLKGGERTAVVEGDQIKPEYQRLVDEVENGEPTEKSVGGKGRKKNAKVRSKRYIAIMGKVDKTKLYPLAQAVGLIQETSLTTFDGTVELHINLNPQSLGDKKDFRGAVTLPHGTGKKVTVVIADEAIIAEIEKGIINFDILVAHPSMMAKLARVARVLGPKGLMPNPKNGTVTDNPEKRVKELSAGQVNFKTEPENPIIHMSVGKVSFQAKQLAENIQAVIAAIGSAKIARVTLSSTMGPGIKILLS